MIKFVNIPAPTDATVTTPELYRPPDTKSYDTTTEGPTGDAVTKIIATEDKSTKDLTDPTGVTKRSTRDAVTTIGPTKDIKTKDSTDPTTATKNPTDDVVLTKTPTKDITTEDQNDPTVTTKRPTGDAMLTKAPTDDVGPTNVSADDPSISAVPTEESTRLPVTTKGLIDAITTKDSTDVVVSKKGPIFSGESTKGPTHEKSKHPTNTGNNVAASTGLFFQLP